MGNARNIVAVFLMCGCAAAAEAQPTEPQHVEIGASLGSMLTWFYGGHAMPGGDVRVTVPTRGGRAIEGFITHEALQNAGSMAYFAILSFFQLLVLGVVVLTFFIGEGDARQFVIEQVQKGSPLDAQTIGEVIDSVVDSRGGIGLIGAVLLVALVLFGWVRRRSAMPFPTAPGSDLPTVLKALFLQQQFTRFAGEVQGLDDHVLHQRFGAFLGAVKPSEASPTQQPGQVRAPEAEWAR